MDCVIRTLLPTEIEAYRALRLFALEESPSAFGASLRQDSLLTDEELAQRIVTTPERFVLGAFAPDQLIGMVGFIRDGGDKHRHKGFIWGMFVRPEFRGQGLGAKLLKETIARTNAMNGLRRVRLSVVTSNQAALQLYEAFGFVRHGEELEALSINGIFHGEYLLVRAVDEAGR